MMCEKRAVRPFLRILGVNVILISLNYCGPELRDDVGFEYFHSLDRVIRTAGATAGMSGRVVFAACWAGRPIKAFVKIATPRYLSNSNHDTSAGHLPAIPFEQIGSLILLSSKTPFIVFKSSMILDEATTLK